MSDLCAGAPIEDVCPSSEIVSCGLTGDFTLTQAVGGCIGQSLTSEQNYQPNVVQP